MVIGFNGFLSYINFTINGDENTVEKAFTLMTYNTMTGIQMVDERYVMTSDIKREFSEMISQEPQPDIILAQEVNRVVEKILPSKTEYPYYHKLKRRGAVIISKYPIVKQGYVDFGAKPNSCLWADINIDGEISRIYSIHLESNRFSNESYKMLTDSDYGGQETLTGLKDIVNKYQKYSSIRAEQAEQVKAHMDKSPYPVIIAGDLNDPPISYAYKTLSKGMNDTFKQKGRGFGTTWNGMIPLLRIDYILSDPAYDIRSFDIIKSNLSDHYPVKAVFELK